MIICYNIKCDHHSFNVDKESKPICYEDYCYPEINGESVSNEEVDYIINLKELNNMLRK